MVQQQPRCFRMTVIGQPTAERCAAVDVIFMCRYLRPCPTTLRHAPESGYVLFVAEDITGVSERLK